MKIKLYDNERFYSIIIEANTFKEIKAICSERVKLSSWSRGLSELLEK